MTDNESWVVPPYEMGDYLRAYFEDAIPAPPVIYSRDNYGEMLAILDAAVSVAVSREEL